MVFPMLSVALSGQLLFFVTSGLPFLLLVSRQSLGHGYVPAAEV
jgi:hypothetical protein